MTTVVHHLPTLPAQAERLIALGLHELAGLSAAQVRAGAAGSSAHGDDALLVLHPGRVPASALAPLVEVDDRAGFVVSDMDDVDAFTPIEAAAPPESSMYLVHGLDRGDAMQNWSPDEALPAITAAGRTPLTLAEGLHWVLQHPAALERGRCFMTVGSRFRKHGGKQDARTPAIWFSNGTGRDGAARRHAPKVGWCWAGNRHTWLGFASASARAAMPTA